ncbi:MAG: hypothetical protein JSU63_10385 [Phycisphaerales bacterium]|nr:MAG: hypothetical protein JSU63_10385 [Phycisphaerales bacterium]
MRRNQFAVCATLLAAVLVAGPAWPQAPGGTAFTYQGQLKHLGVPVNGEARFTFTLQDAKIEGRKTGSTVGARLEFINDLFTQATRFRIRGL